MATKINLQAVSSLFEKRFSDRSGLVRDVKTAEVILREYEQQPRDFLRLKQAKDLVIQVKCFLGFKNFWAAAF